MSNDVLGLMMRSPVVGTLRVFAHDGSAVLM